MKSIRLLLVGVCPLLLIACKSTSTGDPNRIPNQLAVKTRISQSPEKFSKLSSSQKKVVSQGRVAKGMSRESVRLAWGKPDKIQQIKSSVGKKEQWIYLRVEQVDPGSQSDIPGKYGRYFRGSEKYYDGYSHSEFRSVQVEDRTVVFVDGRVVSWTRTRY
jgi:hypothetical protein